MNGLELARGFYEEYGRPMLENEFSDILQYIAVGVVGSGSDRYGFDDEISCDHDFEPGFCIFLPDENTVDRRRAFQLERAYAKLPKEFCGVKRQPISPVGGNRNGVIRTDEFYKKAIGSSDGNLSVQQWLMLPDYALAEAVNGEVFFDAYGEFSQIRKKISEMPEDILLKRIAGNLLIMAQSGQYNFLRCIKHGEPEAAQFACMEFVKSTMRAVFLLNGKYMPYYKWSFRALREIENKNELADKLSLLLFGDNSDKKIANEKSKIIEEISAEIIAEIQTKNMTELTCNDLERQAYSVNDKIKDGTVRNMHILVSIND